MSTRQDHNPLSLPEAVPDVSRLRSEPVSPQALLQARDRVILAQDQAIKTLQARIKDSDTTHARLSAHIDQLEQDLVKAVQEARQAEQLVTSSELDKTSTSPVHHDDARKIRRRQAISDQSHKAALQQLLADLAEDVDERTSLSENVLKLMRERAQHQAHIGNLEAQLTALRRREVHLVEEVDRHAQTLKALRSSTSWRLVAPLRFVLNGLGGLRQKTASTLRNAGSVKGVFLSLAVSTWRQDYKLLRPLRRYILARPALGRRLSIRPDYWDAQKTEIDPYDLDPLGTKAAYPNKLTRDSISRSDAAAKTSPTLPPRPNLIARSADVRDLKKDLRRHARKPRKIKLTGNQRPQS